MGKGGYLALLVRSPPRPDLTFLLAFLLLLSRPSLLPPPPPLLRADLSSSSFISPDSEGRESESLARFHLDLFVSRTISIWGKLYESHQVVLRRRLMEKWDSFREREEI